MSFKTNVLCIAMTNTIIGTYDHIARHVTRCYLMDSCEILKI